MADRVFDAHVSEPKVKPARGILQGWPDQAPHVVTTREALHRYVIASIFVALTTTLIWMVSLVLDTPSSTVAVAVAYPVRMLGASDRNRGWATFMSLAVAMVLFVPGLALATLWLPEVWHTAVAIGFGYFFGAVTYAKVTRWRTGE